MRERRENIHNTLLQQTSEKLYSKIIVNRLIQMYRATLVIKIILCIEITSQVCISLFKTVQWFRLTKPNLRWSGRGIQRFPLRWQIFLTSGRVRIVWTWGGGRGGGGGSGGGGGVRCVGVFNHISVCRKEPLQMLNIGLYGSRASSKTYDLWIGCVCVCVWVSKNEQNLRVSLTAGRCISLCRQKESKKEKQVAAFHVLELRDFLWKNWK